MRTTFLVDGFNVYHSLEAASRSMQGATVKWLDLKSLCTSYLSSVDPKARFEQIIYFSALQSHLECSRPDIIQRHRLYIRCLESTGVEVVMGRFKRRRVRCKSCKRLIHRFEEKETDVAIASMLLEEFHTNACDTIVLLTGDTDLAPAVRCALRLFPHKVILFAFPYQRKNKELKKLSPRSFMIRPAQYAKHQFPQEVIAQDGKALKKPPTW